MHTCAGSSAMSELIHEQFDLTPCNSFGIKLYAAGFASVHDLNELHAALAYASRHGLPVQILGSGSNVLFTADYPGLVVQMNFQGIEHLNEQGLVRAGAGQNWHEFVVYCLNNNLYGLENLALIPGTVGAAPIQNIGAYGVELERFVVLVEVFDTHSGAVTQMSRSECEFSYRDSVFKTSNSPTLLVLSVTLQLHTVPAPNCSYKALQEALGADSVSASPQQIFDTVCQIRRSKLPDPALLGNAGSFFKNPIVSRSKYANLLKEHPAIPCYETEDSQFVKIPAAWLLEQLGWKGRRRGQAGVHAQHALVLVNLGHARGDEIMLLAQEMSSSVLSHFGIALETEVHII